MIAPKLPTTLAIGVETCQTEEASFFEAVFVAQFGEHRTAL